VYFEGDRLVTRRLDSGQTQVQPLNDREVPGQLAQLIGLKPCSQVDQQRCLRMTVESADSANAVAKSGGCPIKLRNEKLKLFHFFTF